MASYVDDESQWHGTSVTTIAVTGAGGSVGRRVVGLLADDPSVGAVKAVDRVKAVVDPRAEFHQVDVANGRLAELLVGCDSVVHLAEDPGRRTDAAVATDTLRSVLAAADTAGCSHAVMLSSALVYGAYADNPVPLTEHQARRPNPDLAYAATKCRLEELAEEWAERSGASLAIMRPTTTLSEGGASFIAGALRAATSSRPEQIDAPVQFLHHDDLAAAVGLVALKRMSGVYNVAPDGWIGPELFNDLLGEAELRLPEPVNDAFLKVKGVVLARPVDRALEPYVSHPWVVANDRLRAAGWRPGFTNEEAYVLGTPAPPWRTFSLRRRQELALGLVGVATVGVAAGLGALARRVVTR